MMESRIILLQIPNRYLELFIQFWTRPLAVRPNGPLDGFIARC